MYNYWAYGLRIQSEIEFPELFPLEPGGDADVLLTQGEVPTVINSKEGFTSPNISISNQEYLLHVKGVGAYYVTEGKNIVIEKDEHGDLDSVRLFCLSNAFAAVLHQRGIIPLHCSAFIDNGELVLIMGDSGAGKSTALALMINAGFTPFSDDVCVPILDNQSGSISMMSSYPMMKYWADTLNLVDLKKSDRKIRPEIEKFGVYFHDRFTIESIPVKMVLILEKSDQGQALTCKKLSGIDLFQRLERNAYRGEYLGYEGLQKEHFKLISSIANSTKSFLIKRPSDRVSTEELKKTIVELLSKKISKA